MLRQVTNTLNVHCLVREDSMSFTRVSWPVGDLSQGKRPHSYQGMIAAAGKQIHGSRTRPRTA
jgi:hypothetical protein